MVLGHRACTRSAVPVAKYAATARGAPCTSRTKAINTDLLIAATLVVATIALWATGRLPEYLTALLFFAAATVLTPVPAATIFSGFASAAFWLVLSGFVLGAAIRKTGLADRLAAALQPHLAGSWLRMVGGTVAVSYAAAFVMPSNMGRIALLMPMVLAIAEKSGIRPGSRGWFGLALAVGFGTFQLSASILPANVPNLVMAGAIEATYGLHLHYLPYLVTFTPLLGVLKGALVVALVYLLFPARPAVIASAVQRTPWSTAERRLMLILLCTLGMWMTDALHGISPAWVGLVAACVCLLPRVGFLTSDEFGQASNFRTCLYVAGLLGLSAFVAATGLGDRVGDHVIPLLPLDPAQPFVSYLSVFGLGELLNALTTANGVPAVFTPLAQEIADASGLPLTTVLMFQVLSYSTPLLPYQASPIVVAMMMGKVPLREGVKLSLWLALATLLVVAPLQFLWMRMLGLLAA